MKKKILSIIIAIVVLLYSAIETDFIGDLEKNIANAIKVSNEIEKVGNFNSDDVLSVHYIDVGQADSILIKTDNYNILIDAGNNDDGKKLVKYFEELGITKFDYVFATHAHEDHIGGMDDIINNFDIDNFYMPDVITTTKTFEDVLDALEKNNLKYSTPKIDDNYKLGSNLIDILYVGDDASDLNDTSIVLKLTHGKNTFLFTGDATSNVEKQILNKDLKSDVLKVGHHGSSYSTSNDFLNKVNPSYAVISVGKNNNYNHPNKTILNKLKNVKLYRTDENGTIIIKSDGININVETKITDTNG